MRRLTLMIIYWSIYVAFAVGIYVQHDSSSLQTIYLMSGLWAGIFAVWILIERFQKDKK